MTGFDMTQISEADRNLLLGFASRPWSANFHGRVPNKTAPGGAVDMFILIDHETGEQMVSIAVPMGSAALAHWIAACCAKPWFLRPPSEQRIAGNIAAAMNAAVVKFVDRDGLIDGYEVAIGCLSVMTAYIADLPPSVRKEIVSRTHAAIDELFEVKGSDGGVEVRHAETGNTSGAAPEAEKNSSATGFERASVREAAIQPCAGVTTGPSELDLLTVQTLLNLLNPLHGELDRQLYDDRMRSEYDVPRERDWHVTVTEGMERDLAQAVLILEERKRGKSERWRHLKRGTSYTVIGRGPLQASTLPPQEGDTIVAYQGDDGRLFFRKQSEFEDGRFVREDAQ